MKLRGPLAGATPDLRWPRTFGQGHKVVSP
jgi:hypothetical protein